MSLENKGIYAGFIGLVFSIIWSVFTYLVPSLSDKNDDIHGIWLQNYGYSMGAHSLEVHGTTEYFNNDSYNFTGEVSVSIIEDEQKVDIIYNVDLSGEWQENDDQLTTKVVGIKSYPIYVSLNSKAIDYNSLSYEVKRQFPSLEDAIPLGTSEKFKIRHLSQDRMDLETVTPEGESLIFTNTKQNRHFDRG